MPKLFQLVLFKNIIFFYVNQSNHPLTLTYLGGCFTLLNRLLSDKKKYVSLSFWSPTTYIKIIKIGGGHLGYFPCQCETNIFSNENILAAEDIKRLNKSDVF